MPEKQMTLDQRRAEHAAQKLGAEVSKELANLAASLPGLIMANGLAMTAAYLDEKKEHLILGHLKEWLLGPETRHLGLVPEGDLVKSLIKSDARAVRAATEEALEYLSWYKRLAKARQKPEGGKE